MVSGRHTSALYKVSGKTGELIWRLGGKNSMFSHSFSFGYQHDARFLGRSADGMIETISFFDNSARSDRQRTGGVDLLHPHSRGRIVQLNHTDGTASEVQTFMPPDNLSVWSQGNVQVLASGNAFVNWGQVGAVTEFRPDGTPIFHAYLDSGALAPGVQSYRGFRYEWSGYSSETPALVALAAVSKVTAYVSWNGDTQVHKWRFYTLCGAGFTGSEIHVLGEAEKTSFETSLTIPESQMAACAREIRIYAEGVDASGAVLVTTSDIGVQAEVAPARKSSYDTYHSQNVFGGEL